MQPVTMALWSAPKVGGQPAYKYPQSSLRQVKWTTIMILSAILGGLSLTTTLAWGRTSSLLQRQSTASAMHSMNVTNCPGTSLPRSIELILISIFHRLRFGIRDRV